ncbi:MAG: exodeoxyribonuclease VII large subunit [Kiritimatiellae bacterium]|nr:exodeoxyribonuclease VII large subunit [Kiritimatiellia bacterium]
MEANGTQILSVSEITEQIGQKLRGIGSVWVEGEISGATTTSAGHTYFALKDEKALLNAVLFAGSRRAGALATGTTLENGKRVQVYGEISVYAPGGKYNISVRQIRGCGIGELMVRFEELKRKLDAEGLFDREKKPPLPTLPHRIGVITSPTGAVIHDIIKVTLRRYSNVQIRLAPARVQGEGAAESVAKAIRYFNEHCGQGSEWEADLLIVARGGGSMEELWPFNEEVLVRAVAGSHIPIISSVGHQTDTTLCDYAATKRAATPSEAAELAVPRKQELEFRVEKLARSLHTIVEQRISTLSAQLNTIRASVFFRHPERITESRSQQIDSLEMRMRQAMEQYTHILHRRLTDLSARLSVLRSQWVNSERTKLARLQDRLVQAPAHKIERLRERVANLENKVRLLNPLSILDRGYSVTQRADGKVVRSTHDVQPGDTLSTRLADGTLTSTVTETNVTKETKATKATKRTKRTKASA